MVLDIYYYIHLFLGRWIFWTRSFLNTINILFFTFSSYIQIYLSGTLSRPLIYLASKFCLSFGEVWKSGNIYDFVFEETHTRIDKKK